MVFKPASWVNESVQELIGERERLDSHTETERKIWRRMATDQRMQGVFSSKYLARRLTSHGWRMWFDCACAVDKEGLKEERERLKEYAELMAALDVHLAGASEILGKIHALDISEKNLPRVMFDPLLLIEDTVEDCRSRFGNERLASFFTEHIKPTLGKLVGFDARYIPNFPQMLATLSWRVFSAVERLRNTVEPGCEITAAALAGRQHAPLPEYVRSFDEMMRHYESETGGADFLMPAELMATQAMVALDLNDVDKKQIKSARGLPKSNAGSQ